MAGVILLTETPSAKISQQELEHILDIRLLLSELRELLTYEEAEIKARLAAGIKVEPGPHQAALEDFYDRDSGQMKTRLIIYTILPADGIAWG